MSTPVDRFSGHVHASMEALSRCHATCLAMAMTECFEMGGEHARPQHLRLMLNCADVSALAADVLARKSQFHNSVCALAADICEVWATDCEILGRMDSCVAICREAAWLCRQSARAGHAETLAMASMHPPRG